MFASKLHVLYHVFCSDHYDFVFLFFCHYIDYLCLSCVTVVVCVCAHGRLFLCVCLLCLHCTCLSVHLYVLLHPAPPTQCSLLAHPAPPIRVPGGECRQCCSSGGRGHSGDQCDRCDRRANAQRRVLAAAH